MRGRFLLGALLLASAALTARPGGATRQKGTAPETPHLQVNASTGESEEQFAARTKWWRDGKFGMFIHWGVYAVPADSTDLEGHKAAGEWFFNNKKMQVRDYDKFAPQLNPVQFDARQWVKTAKDAGMKYIVITSKHHDGFCMFDSKLTDYSITKATPFKRDPMKELAAECRRQGIRLCFYHSIMDWHEPDYVPRRPWEGQNRPAAGASLDRYVEHMKGQLRELLTNYGPVGIIWFDGGWEHNPQELRSQEVNSMIRSIQPRIMINDRNHLPEDYSTPEQSIPANALPGGRLWETCMTMNDTWGYAKNDTDWKSAEDLIRKLCDIASKGGNFLLNVGPTGEGVFPDAINERLARMGEWMKVNSASIYGTTKSPFWKTPFDGRCTTKGNTLYLQVFHWPDGPLALSGLQTRAVSARVLDGGQRLRVSQALGVRPLAFGSGSPKAQGRAPNAAVTIGKPARIDPVATVVELRLDGPPVVAETASLARPAADGSFDLKAAEAEIHGQTAQYEQGGGKDNIGFWTNRTDYVTWECDVPRAARYRVEVVYACQEENAGSRFTVGASQEAQVSGEVKATGSWTEFRPESLGEIGLPAGRQAISVRITEMPRGAAMNLKEVRLVPAR